MKDEKACRVPQLRKSRVALRALLNYAATAILLLVILRFFPRLGNIESYADTAWVVLIVAALDVGAWPFLIRVFLVLFRKTPPVATHVIFLFISLVAPAVLLQIAARLSPGLTINGFGSALVISALMAIISSVFAGIFAADDESLIYQWLLKKTGARLADAEDRGKPGLVFLEIDGLAGETLEYAMNNGKAPVMKRWLDCGSHKMVVWNSDLSSQSSAAQAGILHGNNYDIPAYRWYDKELKRVVVANSVNDMAQLEKRISNGNGLLSRGGTARASVFSGDASRVLMTASRAYDASSNDPAAYYAYYLNPSSMLRSLALMAWDWVLEKKAAWDQILRNEKPRVSRGGIYFLQRSLLTVFARDFALSAVRGDMYSGVPYIYATLAGYDEVSHFSGVTRPDSMEVLRKLDHEFGRLEKAARDGARSYKFVVLSDHGSSQGATFRARYGESLADTVRRLVNSPGKSHSVAGYGAAEADAYGVGAAVKDYALAGSSSGRGAPRRPCDSRGYEVGGKNDSDIVVLASGNMGLISFVTPARRLTLEDIAAETPSLLPGLVKHPGIGFVMVRSKTNGAVVMGKHGTLSLATGIVEGEDPLAVYGTETRGNLARTDTFPNVPDILVMSTYWPETDEVAAFQEHVASHGGAGGRQSRPFILYPAKLQLGTDRIAGAEAVYGVFKRWTGEVLKS